ncbi:class I SAM-dependent methyltransferase [Balneolaceae bacterium YR4-1]|uniref:Class I SAM-dependent methyltransferase n=1 Tax=Halalkalibaculum roseum TaxID=2709311 RepID=A0A6M1T887_9BACT|nr:class I SAM-dependent methyltransferase [Halalkalibaculum roseum]NGP76493.1 class I SAM-dependent methyltransferase [Halalkalibaculum roseum]
MEAVNQPEYSTLAEIYDHIMQNVDYDVWADFIDEIIQVHHPDPQSILELACGTGSLSLSLEELMCYEIVGTDKSPAMISKARNKNQKQASSVRFLEMDFLDISLDRKFDAVVSIFDSINYLHKSRSIKKLLNEVKKVIDRNSLFIFDFTTPGNSIQAIEYLDNEEGTTENNYHFFRKSRYDEELQIHYNDFKIEKLADDNETVTERHFEQHKQRIYTLQQMLDIIEATDFEIVAKYDAFDLIEADDDSLRITMVLRCPTIQ